MKRTAVLLPLVCLLFVAICHALLEGGIWPEASGIDVKYKDDMTIDYSNASQGYVMVSGAKSSKGLKLRVTKGKSQLMYDLNKNGSYEAFPLQLGSGEYKFELFQNVSGTKYAAAGSTTIDAKLSDENIAFLSPNQYVYYTRDSEAVKLSEELLSGLETDKEKFEVAHQYVLDHFSYDFDKAKKVTGGTLPSIEYLLENNKGICQDLSAFLACMLRVQGIPTQLVIGYANKYYHAWNNVLIDGEYVQVDLTADIGALPGEYKYTVERIY